MQPGGPMGMHPQMAQQHLNQQMGGPGSHPPQQPPQQQQPGPQQAGEQKRIDNISRAKALLPAIKDTLGVVFKAGAQAVYSNNMIDSGSKPVEQDTGRFDQSLEEFFSICDQMEMHLKTSIECLSQGQSSQRCLSTPVTPNKMDGSITYPQYINVVKGQIAFAKEIHCALADKI